MENISNDTSHENLIPFGELQKNFIRKDNFHATIQSSKIKTKEQFDKFSRDLEDLMRAYGVYSLAAAIFADL